jgi:hypothetical protein
MLGVSKVEAVDQILTILEAIFHTLKEDLFMYHNHIQKHVDRGCSKRQFVEGD